MDFPIAASVILGVGSQANAPLRAGRFQTGWQNGYATGPCKSVDVGSIPTPVSLKGRSYKGPPHFFSLNILTNSFSYWLDLIFISTH